MPLFARICLQDPKQKKFNISNKNFPFEIFVYWNKQSFHSISPKENYKSSSTKFAVLITLI